MTNLRNAAKHATLRLLPSLYVRWQLLRDHEPELAWLDKFVPPNCPCIDVGAHFGLYTRRLARIASSVHAFEPVAEMAEVLRRTSASNVIVHRVAVSDRNGTGLLTIPIAEGRMQYALASITSDCDVQLRTSVQRTVRLVRLDSIFDGPVGFIKIDVEGHELNVLDGSANIIAQSRPSFLIEAEERHWIGATRSLFEFFTRQDYSGFFIVDNILKPIGEFNPTTLQASCADRIKDKYRRRPYVNNFFFSPR
jgi:FkbM family methyltransferase